MKKYFLLLLVLFLSPYSWGQVNDDKQIFTPLRDGSILIFSGDTLSPRLSFINFQGDLVISTKKPNWFFGLFGGTTWRVIQWERPLYNIDLVEAGLEELDIRLSDNDKARIIAKIWVLIDYTNQIDITKQSNIINCPNLPILANKDYTSYDRAGPGHLIGILLDYSDPEFKSGIFRDDLKIGDILSVTKMGNYLGLTLQLNEPISYIYEDNMLYVNSQIKSPCGDYKIEKISPEKKLWTIKGKVCYLFYKGLEEIWPIIPINEIN